MRIRKVRGHRRRWKNIARWVEYSKQLDLNDIKSYERDYVKFYVNPWSGLSLINSDYAEPNGETKSKIVSGLIEIYSAWKTQLDALNEPYYLKIWLHEPNISHSQVVCALGSCLDFYKNTFFKPEQSECFNSKRYSKKNSDLNSFSWDYHYDEFHFSNLDLDEEPDYYRSYLNKPHRVYENDTVIELDNGTQTKKLDKTYSVKIGNVWLGEIK